MGRPQIKWAMVEKYFSRRGYEIRGSGGDKIIVAPKDGKTRSRNTVLIGHNYCSHAGDELANGHLKQLKHAFGVKWEDILNG